MDDVKDLFILRCFSRISGISSSDEVFVNIKYPKKVIKIGIFMYTIKGERILSLNKESENIGKIGFAFKKDIDRDVTKKEYKEIIEKLNKNKITQRLIIEKIFE